MTSSVIWNGENRQLDGIATEHLKLTRTRYTLFFDERLGRGLQLYFSDLDDATRYHDARFLALVVFFVGA